MTQLTSDTVGVTINMDLQEPVLDEEQFVETLGVESASIDINVDDNAEIFWEFDTNPTPPARGQGNIISRRVQVSSGNTNIPLDFTGFEGQTGYLHVRAVNGRGEAPTILTSQPFSVPFPIVGGSSDFEFVVQTTSPGELFTIKAADVETFNAVVDWGDGSTSTITTWDDADLTHIYATAGNYTVSISGTFPAIRMLGAANDSANKIIQILQFGDVGWRNFLNAFRGCSNLVQVTAAPCDVTQVGDMNSMFRDSGLTTADFTDFVTTGLTNTGNMFRGIPATVLNVANFDMNGVNAVSAMFMDTNIPGLDLRTWDWSTITTGTDFLRNTGLSQSNYDALLIAADAQTLPNLSIDFGNSIYTGGGAAETARTGCIADGWTITDGGADSVVIPPVDPPATTGVMFGIGINSYFDSTWVYINMLRHANPNDFTASHANGTARMDNVTSNVSGIVMDGSAVSNSTRSQSNRVFAYWNGNGAITLSGAGVGSQVSSGSDSKGNFREYVLNPSGRINWAVTGVSGGNAMTNPAVIFSKHRSIYIAGATWDPDHIDRVRNAPYLRFLAAQKINNSTLQNWADRPTVNKIVKGAHGTRADEGISVEEACQLCIEANSRPWLHVPHLATNDFITQMANTINTEMSGTGLVPIVELSNECWNPQFAQTTYFQGLGNAEFGSQQNQNDRGRNYYALKTRAMGYLMKQVLGDSGVDIVACAQKTNLWSHTQMLEGPMITSSTRYPGLPTIQLDNPTQYVDLFSVSNYWDNTSNSGLVGATEQEWLNRIDWNSFERGIENINAVAKRNGVKWTTYEGGPHQWYGPVDDAALASAITYHSGSRIVEAYDRAYNFMATQDSWDGVFSQFLSVARWSTSGCWSAWEHPDQPSHPRAQWCLDKNNNTVST